MIAHPGNFRCRDCDFAVVGAGQQQRRNDRTDWAIVGDNAAIEIDATQLGLTGFKAGDAQKRCDPAEDQAIEPDTAKEISSSLPP